MGLGRPINGHQLRIHFTEADLCRLRVAPGRIQVGNPPRGIFPDFLTPAITDTDLDAHFDAIVNLSSPPRWARDLFADGRADGLVNVLRRYHTPSLTPTIRSTARSTSLVAG